MLIVRASVCVLVLCLGRAIAQYQGSVWPCFGRNSAHTQVTTAQGPSTAHLFWTFATNGQIFGSAAIGSDGTVYIGSDDYHLYALTFNGHLKWNFSTGGQVQTTPAIGSDGTVYFGSGDSNFYAVTSSGKLKWQYDVGTGTSMSSSPVIGTNGLIYAGSFSDNLYAFSADGDLVWKYVAADVVVTNPAIGGDGTIYTGDYGDNIYALYSNLTLKWKYAGNVANTVITGAPTVFNDVLYVPSGDSYLYALTLAGKLIWKTKTDTELQASVAVSPDGQHLYVGNIVNRLYSFNVADGSIQWNFTLNPTVCNTDYSCSFMSSPSVGSDGTIYVGSLDDTLYAISPAGQMLWNYTTGGDVWSAPAISSAGILYIGSYDKKVYAFSPATCEEGYYIGGSGGDFCVKCPIGEYTDTEDAAECTVCVYPWTTRFEGQTSCDGVSLFYDTTTTAVVLCALGFMVLICMGVGEQRAAIFINLFFPTLDVFTDLAYLISNDFYSIVLFVFCALSIVIPTGYLFKILYERGAYPRLWWSLDRAFWLEAGNGDDYVYFPVFPAFEDNGGRLPYFSKTQHHSLFSVTLEVCAWVIAIFAQFATICVIIPGNCLFLVFWLMVGSFLHLTKMLVVGKVWNKWFQVWTLSNDHDTDVDVDTAELIFCLEQEFYIETIPQFIIQLINNLLLERFTTIAAFSIALSIVMSFNGVWRFWYYRYILKETYALEDIPVDTSIHIYFPAFGIDWHILDAKLESRTKGDPSNKSYKEPMLPSVPARSEDDDEEQQYQPPLAAPVAAPVAQQVKKEAAVRNPMPMAYAEPVPLPSFVQNQDAPPSPPVERNLS